MNPVTTDQPRLMSKCEQLLERAKQSIAGGDSSTMRVLPYHLPLVATRGEGCRLWDADGNEFIDLNMAYGPLLLGHCPDTVSQAVARQVRDYGSQLGFPTEISVRVAEKIKQLFPSMELMRFANSGTEALASAIRLARTATGRPKHIQFEGQYHGWSDSLFNRYHMPLDELPRGDFGPAVSGTNGMNGAPHDAIVCRWNNPAALERCLQSNRGQIAAIIMEPISGNAGVIPPHPGYLEQVQAMARDHGALLIFDEVITGLRVAAGGAQQLYDVVPDITVISKALGGGYPVAAFGASRDIMQPIVDGTLFHGGVYSANAVVMAAAEAVLDEVLTRRDSLYKHLYTVGDQLALGLDEILRRAGVPHVVQHIGPMISVFLTKQDDVRIHEYRDVRRNCNFDKYIALQHEMQRAGVYFHPNQFEPLFLSKAHGTKDIGEVLDRVEHVVSCMGL